MWVKWGDDGDAAIQVSAETQTVVDGRQSLRVVVDLGGKTNYWPSLGLDLTADMDIPPGSLLELHLYVPPEAADLPEGTVNLALMRGAEAVSRASLRQAEAGTWNRMVLSLAGAEDRGAVPCRVKLAFRPAEGAAGPLTFFVDGVRLAAAGAGHGPVTELKDLCLETVIAAGGKAQAAIVAPVGGRYDGAVAAIQAAVKRCGGIELPVLADDAGDPAQLLADRSLIVLGNMSTSRLMWTLYREYYTFLDLKYPGPGGHVVRSLHNPYATGRNVILVGGSDDGGVRDAAEAFAGLLQPGDPLQVGWLMQIKLGEGVQPPDIGETIYGWRDSYRVRPDGSEIGYAPCTYFGWNEISAMGALYYMTGEEKYLREFVRRALPDPRNVPQEVRTSPAFYSMEHPLVENYHYRAHLDDLIWDLIEESPLLSDDVRLRITNELRDHQDFIDAEDDYMPLTGMGRHGTYDALCVYAGSRYFAKYYPAPRWQQRLENMRRAFSWWLTDPTWGELDTLSWVSTSIEPVMEYWMLSDPDTYVRSGGARRMISAIEMLWGGQPYEENARDIALSLMQRASWLLDDGRYAWMVRQMGFDLDVFRIGQSWWPSPEMKLEPPADRIGRISVMPISQRDLDRAGAPFGPDGGYQFLSYRTGWGPDDDFFFLDGNDGGGRNPHHVSALKYLRQRGGRLLEGYGNMVAVLRDGMSENLVAKAARLDASVALDGLAWVRSTVPNEAFSSWRRDLLYVGDDFTIVADGVTARDAGQFEVECRWAPMGRVRPLPDGMFGSQQEGGMRATVLCAMPAEISFEYGHLVQKRNVSLQPGEGLGFVNIVYAADKPDEYRYRLRPLTEDAAVISGATDALFASGPVTTAPAGEGGLTVEADLSLVSPERVCMLRARSLAATVPLIQAAAPVSLSGRLAEGTMAVQCDADTQLALACSEGARPALDGAPAQVSAA
ncbi:MAG TPA: hypothetical protein VM283_09045, partial [Armatimonadota bacterium]|nr:hypothetical protein [Armatimonadota bacterium]